MRNDHVRVLGKLILYTQDTGHTPTINTCDLPPELLNRMDPTQQPRRQDVRTVTLVQVEGKKANKAHRASFPFREKNPTLHREEASRPEDGKAQDSQYLQPQEAGHNAPMD